MFQEHKHKSPKYDVSKCAVVLERIHLDQVAFIPEMQGWFSIWKSVYFTILTKWKIEGRNRVDNEGRGIGSHVIISVGKKRDKISHITHFGN